MGTPVARTRLSSVEFFATAADFRSSGGQQVPPLRLKPSVGMTLQKTVRAALGMTIRDWVRAALGMTIRDWVRAALGMTDQERVRAALGMTIAWVGGPS